MLQKNSFPLISNFYAEEATKELIGVQPMQQYFGLLYLLTHKKDLISVVWESFFGLNSIKFSDVICVDKGNKK